MFLSFFIYFRADTHTVQSISCSFALVLLVFVVKKKKKENHVVFSAWHCTEYCHPPKRKELELFLPLMEMILCLTKKSNSLFLYFTRSSKTLGNSMMTKNKAAELQPKNIMQLKRRGCGLQIHLLVVGDRVGFTGRSQTVTLVCPYWNKTGEGDSSPLFL